MFFTMLLTLAVFVLGLFADHLIDRKRRPKWFYLIFIVLVVAGAGLIVRGYFDQKQDRAEREKAEAKSTQLEETLNTLNAQIGDLNSNRDSLKAYLDVVKGRQDVLLTAVRDCCKPSEPTKIETTFVTPKEVAALPSQGILLQSEKTRLSYDPRRKLYYGAYFFRARYPLPARDIRIKMVFDTELDTAAAKQIGAIVEDYGTRLTMDQNRKTIEFVTGFLRAGNQILVEVAARSPISVAQTELYGD